MQQERVEVRFSGRKVFLVLCLAVLFFNVAPKAHATTTTIRELVRRNPCPSAPVCESPMLPPGDSGLPRALDSDSGVGATTVMRDAQEGYHWGCHTAPYFFGFNFHSSYQGSQNCFVSFGLTNDPIYCGRTSFAFGCGFTALDASPGVKSITFNYGDFGSPLTTVSKSFEIVPLATFDRDEDGILDDGDQSRVIGDHPCMGGAITGCDDNCVEISNPDQADSDGDGTGDVCEPPPPPPPPVPSFKFSPTTPKVGDKVKFEVTSSSNQIMQWHWDFGDGKTANGKKIEHTFVEEDTFSVVLTVTATNMGTSSHTESVDIRCVPGKTAESLGINPTDCDGDALPNDWEINGIDNNGDGDSKDMMDLDLPAMGADPLQKDIFVEVDYMESPSHSHQPDKRAMNGVIDAFKAAPVWNPDPKKKGIILHIDYGQDRGKKKGLFTEGNGLLHAEFLPGFQDPQHFDLSYFDKVLKGLNFKEERQRVFHYGVFAHALDSQGTRGYSIPTTLATDFVVALGQSPTMTGTPFEQAIAFMHELGHNLGLNHGGALNVQGYSLENKPNYLSVMNVSFRLTGLFKKSGKTLKAGTLDFARFHLPDLGGAGSLPLLNEAGLDETLGLATPNKEAQKYGSGYYCGGVPQPIFPVNAPVNWDCDNPPIFETSAHTDINGNGTIDALIGDSDWDKLIFDGGGRIGPLQAGTISSAQIVQEQLEEVEIYSEQNETLGTLWPPLQVVQNTIAENKVQFKWTPLGIDSITEYNVYCEETGGRMTLVTSIPSSQDIEEKEWFSLNLPSGCRYGVTAVYSDGGESHPAWPMPQY